MESSGLAHRNRRYILIEQGCTSAAFNFALNGAIAWLVFHNLAVIPLWGATSIAADTLGMAWALPFGTCFAASLQVHRDLRRGRIAPVPLNSMRPALLSRLPRSVLARCVVCGVAGLLTVPPVVGLLALLGVDTMAFEVLLVWKALLAMGLALLCTPLIVVRALGDDYQATLWQRLF